MPIFLLLVGVALIVSGIHGTSKDLFALIKGDFTGQGNFAYWFVSIMAIGAVGYIKKLQPVSDSFLVLVLVVLFLKSGTRFFAQFTNALNSTASNPASSAVQVPAIPALPTLPDFGVTTKGW